MGKGTTHKFVLAKFGRKIQQIRKNRKLTQDELAAMIHVHKNYIGMIERGERNPTTTTIYKLAKALRVPSTELMPF